MKPRFPWLIHLVLLVTAGLTLAPFAFMVNNAFRSTPEFYHGFFAVPAAARQRNGRRNCARSLGAVSGRRAQAAAERVTSFIASSRMSATAS